MENLKEIEPIEVVEHTSLLPVTVIIPVRNEAQNLPRCLEALRNFSEVYVVDSQSTDETVEIARSCGAKVVQFHYRGAWPRSGSGQSTRCRSPMTGSFFWMQTRGSRPRL